MTAAFPAASISRPSLPGRSQSDRPEIRTHRRSGGHAGRSTSIQARKTDAASTRAALEDLRCAVRQRLSDGTGAAARDRAAAALRDPTCHVATSGAGAAARRQAGGQASTGASTGAGTGAGTGADQGANKGGRLARWLDIASDLAIEGERGPDGAGLRVIVRRSTEFELRWLRSSCGAALEEVVRSVLGPGAVLEYLVEAVEAPSDASDCSHSAPAIGRTLDAEAPPTSPWSTSACAPDFDASNAFISSTASIVSGAILPDHTARLRPSLEDFVVGRSNEVAYRAAQDMVGPTEAPRSLFIDGSCGVGKTHLLRAICNRRRDLHPGCEVLYTTGEAFTNDFLTALRGHQLEAFRARIRRLDLLAIDDVHFLADKNRTSSEFLHTIDHIGRHCKQVVLASDAPLDRLQAFSHALRSRLMQGVLVHIDLPDPALRLTLVRRFADRRNLRLSPEAEEFIATHVEGTAREIEGALQRLALEIRLDRRSADFDATRPRENASSAGSARPHEDRPVRVPAQGEDGSARVVDCTTAAVALRDLTGDRGAPLRPQAILAAACSLLRIDRSDLLGRSRHPQAVLGRMLVTAAARTCTTLSFPEISRLLGRSAHSTVHHAWSRAQALMTSGERIPHAVETGPTTLSELLEQVKRIARRPG